LSMEAGLELFDTALMQDTPVPMCAHFETKILQRQANEGLPIAPLLRGVISVQAKRASLWLERLVTMPEQERFGTVLELVRSEVVSALGLTDLTLVAPDEPLQNLGLDSLIALELRNRLAQRFGMTLPATLAIDYPTPESIVGLVLERAALVDVHSVEPARTVAPVDEPIAVVGMACRLPGGVESPEDFWELLVQGRDAVGPFPERWDAEALYDPDPEAVGKSVAKEGGFLENPDLFDAGFFGITPREAVAMDPQQRLALEVTWEALERAGLSASALREHDTGIYIGTMGADYSNLSRTLDDLDGYRLTGNASSVLSGRLAYVLGLRGPVMTIDTACSSSLVALHLACSSLRQGECQFALAGGSQVMATPMTFVEFSRLRGLAPDGRCKSFSAQANGAGWSEGAGMLVLERLSDAQAAGRPVLAVIRSSAINHDGRSQGLTAPNGPSQQALIRQTLDQANLLPTDMDHVETHGTGTPLGDPIEAGALAAVFGPTREASKPLYIGSSKSNLGHTQAAAGVTGVMKVVLSLMHGELPKTLHAEEPSPHIEWEGSGLELLHERRPWPQKDGSTRRAGVSSFGISGTNVHVIVEEPPRAPKPRVQASQSPLMPLVLSARDDKALRALAGRWAAGLESGALKPTLSTLYSAASRRTHFDTRLSVAAESPAELTAALAAIRDDEHHPPAGRGQAIQEGVVAMLFTGQGSQVLGMGRALMEAHEPFRILLEKVLAVLDGYLETPLASVLFADKDGPQAALIHETQYTQPALFAIEVALADLWRSWGVRPDILMGHSVGELSAAYVSGLLSLEDAAKLVCARGRLMQGCRSDGAMLSIKAPESEVLPLIEGWTGQVEIAGLNSPVQTVVSGDADAIDAVAAHCDSAGKRTTRLTVSHAFHSPHMDAMLHDLEAVAAECSFMPPSIPIVSNVTGELATFEQLRAPAYWAKHVREAVRFVDGVKVLEGQGVKLCLECGPRGVLSSLGAMCVDSDALRFIPTFKKNVDETASLREAIGLLFTHGVALDWATVVGEEPPSEYGLPTYPFQRKRYWLDVSPAASGAGGATGHPLLGAGSQVAGTDMAVFTTAIAKSAPSWVSDHVVMEQTIFPAAGFMELMAAAAEVVGGDERWDLGRVVISAPLSLPERGDVRIQVTVDGLEDDESRRVRVYSGQSDDSWVLHTEAKLLRRGEEPPPEPASALPPDEAEALDVEDMYPLLAESGLSYGPSFQGLQRAWRVGERIWSHVILPEQSAEQAGRYGLHPALLDGCLHTVALAVSLDVEGEDLYLPFSMGALRVWQPGASSAWVELAPLDVSEEVIGTSMTFYNEQGFAIGELDHLQLKRADLASLKRAAGEDAQRMRFEVIWEPSELNDAVFEGQWGIWWPDQANNLTTTVLGPTLSEAGATVHLVSDMSEALSLSLDGLLCFWSEDEEHFGDVQRVTEEALRQLQALRAAGTTVPVTWVTQNAVATGTDDRVQGLTVSTLWGLLRTARSEHPDWAIKLVDLGDSDDDLSMLPQVVAAAEEHELAIRGGAVLAPRLVRSRERGLSFPERGAWRVQIGEKGRLDRLEVTAFEETKLDAGFVRVEVKAAGINFRDVLNALGMVYMPFLGLELAGIVTEVGEGVDTLEVGDAVFGLGEATFASSSVADARVMTKLPEGMSFEEGATIPLAFLTAWYALFDLGGLKKGERILIHAATGGVGMAAVQLAQHCGAEIFGTASQPKWNKLRELGLDDAHIASSRDLAFERSWMKLTEGQGVDVVLNALAREFVDASLRCLGSGGRFLEMGKTDVRDDAWLTAHHPDLTYRAFDLMEAGPDRIQAILLELAKLFESGDLKPLPLLSFPMKRISGVFRFMAQARHMGKLVLVPGGEKSVVPRQGTVLVTGGMGALGQHVARWLVREHGVEHIILTSRRGPTAPGAEQLVQEIAAMGASAEVIACDVSKRDDVARLLTLIPAERPLRGVIHSAGVLDDGLLADLNSERLAKVLAPKVGGAWQLHVLTKQADLDFFVLFSSIAGVMGGAAQANYAAANTFLDGLAAYRQARGLPGVSIAWGPWAEGGMAANLSATDRARMERQGFSPIDASTGMALLDASIRAEGSLAVATALDTRRLQNSFESSGVGVPALFKNRIRSRASASVNATALTKRLEALVVGEREGALLEIIRDEVAQVLGLTSGRDVDPGTSLQELGADSLMAVELRNRLSAFSGVTLPSTLVFDYPTTSAITGFLLSQLQLGDTPTVRAPRAKRKAALLGEPIAIVSMACRFPGGVTSPEELWALIEDERDAIVDVPRSRFDIEALFDPDPDAVGKTYSRWGGFIPNIDRFDAAFFGLSPREA
ncbi:MAG: SDR family NAD(P)-dependent oxidoreductase, partial [Myxococcota bacterium]|nr:SDR family NAD(P)-dependent oxidoreductase [Myxococcota bacterium]